jgi:hypothetical protein
MTVFWDNAPYSLVEVDRRFRGAYCLHHQGTCTEKWVAFSVCAHLLTCIPCSSIGPVKFRFTSRINFSLSVLNVTDVRKCFRFPWKQSRYYFGCLQRIRNVTRTSSSRNESRMFSCYSSVPCRFTSVRATVRWPFRKCHIY